MGEARSRVIGFEDRIPIEFTIAGAATPPRSCFRNDISWPFPIGSARKSDPSPSE